MKVWVVLPAYDEAPRIPLLLERWVEVLAWLDLPHQLVAVDDGSRDGTGQALRAFAGRYPHMTVLTHTTNQGLGATLRDGLQHVAEAGAAGDVLAVMDGDNTHPPELFPGMLERLERSSCDIVIASRYRAGARIEGLSLPRRLFSHGARVLFQAVHRVRGVRDYTCGYRVYRLGMVQRAFAHYGERFVEQSGFECMAEVLLKLARIGARCEEVPLELDYRAKAGASHMNVRRTIVRTLQMLGRSLRV